MKAKPDLLEEIEKEAVKKLVTPVKNRVIAP